jgi:hypothetical protein
MVGTIWTMKCASRVVCAVVMIGVCRALSSGPVARVALAANQPEVRSTVPLLMQRCVRWTEYTASHPATTVSPVIRVTVKAFFVEHVAIGVGGRRGGLYAKRVPDRLLMRQSDSTPFVLVELGDTNAGRSLPSGHWVVLTGKFDRGQCVVYHLSRWNGTTSRSST